ncbi:sigma 54-interacting transcriptional regulator [Paludifilum halophilum]|uniref:Sigma-54 factor interaction domain-containing protein n=1 Tax=Paludifilum halophilum TaxID=1642702 RepID=A0A235B3V4_9BACL|nr:sigma-54-dependent transcriptional regulator [Paludifilum halophilum]OYD06902.1 hypothetical protein CHM34_13250 [Paludifilum halophilum]
MNQLNRVEYRLQQFFNQYRQGCSAKEIGKQLQLDRSTASRYLNELVKKERARKVPGRPVLYLPAKTGDPALELEDRWRERFPSLVGARDSLRPHLEEAMAALLYPPRGLPLLLYGETGVGKSYLARSLYQAARKEGRFKDSAPFIAFNCSEYAQNPELLVSQLFGVKKGAFTGADADRTGLVERAEGGVLFLDEIHRLPPAGQEMLFYLIDRGTFRRLGETTTDRTADVRLIGATTGSPEEALLPTLYRRFSVQLSLPPLRQRTRIERERLLDTFLQAEAEQMRVQLSIAPECRSALLSYECQGNIGQLKSDVQIACARAFLRHLRSRGDRDDSVKLETGDLPDAVRAAIPSPPPAVTPDPSIHLQDRLPGEMNHLPNVYEQLTRRERELSLQGMEPEKADQELERVVNQYIHALMETSRIQPGDCTGGKRLLGEEWMNTLQNALEKARPFLPEPITDQQTIALGLHLQAFMNRPRGRQNTLPALPPDSDRYLDAAHVLAEALEEETNVRFPREEVQLIALLLSSRSRPSAEEKRVAVLVAAHGDSSARSMADVTNTFLGRSAVHSVDMPLYQPPEVAYRRIAQKVKEIDRGAGVLILVDMGSLTTMGEAVRREAGLPVEIIPQTHLPMVIEAGRKSLLPENDLSTLAESVRLAARSGFPPGYSFSGKGFDPPQKRMIATVCLTGEGAAVLLENWLREHLRPQDSDVWIRSLHLEPNTRSSLLLQHLASEHRLIAVVGTISPELDGVPFLPAWELLQPEGIDRLWSLLDATPASSVSPASDSGKETISREEIPSLVEQGLLETITHLNPRLFVQVMDREMAPLCRRRSLEPERELGLWMHVGVMTDHLLKQRLKGEKEESDFPPEENPNELGPIHPAAVDDWSRVLQALTETFALPFPSGTAEFLSRLSG